MADNDKWAIISAAMRGPARPRRTSGGGGRAREFDPNTMPALAAAAAVVESAKQRDRAGVGPGRRAGRAAIEDLTKDDGTRTAACFRRIQARMVEQLALVEDPSVYREGEFVLTPEFRARRAKVGRELLRSGRKPDTMAPRTTTAPRPRTSAEIRQLQKRRSVHVGAMHEAAHAVVAHALGLEVTQTRLTGRHSGETDVTFRPPPADGSPDEGFVAVLYAGVRGEQVHPEWDEAFMDLWPLQDDYRLLEEYLAALDLEPSDELALRERVIANVDEVLERDAAVVVDLARVLVRDRTVSGPRLQLLLSGGSS